MQQLLGLPYDTSINFPRVPTAPNTFHHEDGSDCMCTKRWKSCFKTTDLVHVHTIQQVPDFVHVDLKVGDLKKEDTKYKECILNIFDDEVY